LLPKAIYKHIRLSSNQDPVSASPSKAIQWSKQTKDYLLCSDCEGRFSKNGEDWVLKNYVKTSGNFPILQNLSQASPVKQHGNDSYYKCDSISGVDVDKISYFATSVFWRAAAHSWKTPLGQTLKLDFGSYEEELRLYLLGQTTFPRNAILSVLVAPNTTPPMATLFPATLPRKPAPYYRHGFYMPGLLFTLCLGQQITPDMIDECSVHSRILRVSDLAIKLANSAWSKVKAA